MERIQVAPGRATLRAISLGLEGHLELVEVVDELRFFRVVRGEFFEARQEASSQREGEGVDEVFEGAAFAADLFALVGVFSGDEVAEDGFGEVVGESEFEEACAVEVGAFFGGGEGEEGDGPGVVGDAFGSFDADALPAASHLVFEGECAVDELDRAGVHGVGKGVAAKGVCVSTFGAPGSSPLRGRCSSPSMYLVVACGRCRRARVVEQGRKTATCASCSRVLELRDLRAYSLGPLLEEAQEVAGRLNAKLAGRKDEYLAAMVVPRAPAPRHDDRWNAAAAAARRATGETGRADAVARALGEFEDAELAAAFELAGLRESNRHLRRMLATQVVFEPRPGVFKALS